jgi:CHASE3 domain sensor protein
MTAELNGRRHAVDSSPLTSNTRRMLRWLRAALLVATGVALGGCLTVFVQVSRTADAASAKSVPATLAVYRAQVALRQAHGAAVQSLIGGERILGGPRDDYQNQITRAGQYLAEVAEDNAAGDAGSGDVQAVEALLAVYMGLIHRADVHFQRANVDCQQPDAQCQAVNADALGTAALRDASSVLDEILTRLDHLRDKQADVLADQAGSPWSHPATTLVWLFPVLVLAALLVLAQVFLRHRFRRLLCVPLLFATGFVVVMGAATALSISSARQLDTSRDAVNQLGSVRTNELGALRERDSGRLAGLLRQVCGTAGCEQAIRQLVPEGTPPPTTSDDKEKEIADKVDTAEQQAQAIGGAATDNAATAANSAMVEFVLPVAALIVAVLVVAGFQPRLEEYRYRPR